MKTMELTCICCPVGCVLKAEIEGNEVKSVSGNGCKRGMEYACQECIAPVRVITGTVPVRGGTLERIAVKTERAVDKNMIFSVMEAVHGITIDAPVKIGDVILENIAGTGANLVAARCCEAK